MRIISTVICTLLLTVLTTLCATADQSIALQGEGVAAAWGFGNGGEFPGARGGLKQDSRSVTLDYDFTGGGAYVCANYNGITPPQTESFSVTAKPQQRCRVSYRMTDANGRVFQGATSTLEANQSQTLTMPCRGSWQSAWGGSKPTDQPELPIQMLWILANHEQDVPKTGRVVLSEFKAISTAVEPISILGTQRPSSPFGSGKLERLKEGWCVFPKERKLGRNRVVMGYNEPGEAENDMRDLRIISPQGETITGMWGRVQVTGELEYVTPTDFPIQSREQQGHLIWQWAQLDQRLGFQQMVHTDISDSGVNSTIYVRFLKPHKGTIRMPFALPNGQVDMLAGDGSAQNPYTKVLFPSQVSRMDYQGAEGVISTHIVCANPRGVSLSIEPKLFSHVFRKELRMAVLELTPPADGVFPAGYVNAVQLRVGYPADTLLPKLIAAPNWPTRIDVAFLEPDKATGWTLTRVNQPRVYTPEEVKQVGLSLYQTGPGSRKVTIKAELRDYTNRLVWRSDEPLTLKAQTPTQRVLKLPVKSKGIYSLSVKVVEAGSVQGERLCRIAVVPKPVTITAEKSYFGIDPVFYEGFDQNMRFLRKIGVRWLRLGGGVWYPDEGDRAYLTKLRQYDIGSFLIINSPEEVRPASYNDLIDYYEIGNEPDAWITPEDYAGLAARCAEKVRQVNPKTKILACSVSGGDSDGGFAFTKRFLAAGGAKSCEIIPFHPYSGIRAFGPELEPVSPEDNSMYEKLMEASQLTSQNNLEVWLGEIGYLMVNGYRQPQARFHEYEKSFANTLTRLMLISRTIPGMKRVIWFHLCADDTPLKLYPNHQSTYNNLGPNNNITPNLAAYANLASLSDGGQFIGKLKLTNPKLWGVQIRQGSRDVLALWSSKGQIKLNWPGKEAINTVSMVGTDGQLKPQRGQMSLTLGEEPVYLVVPSSKASALVKAVESATQVVLKPTASGSSNAQSSASLKPDIIATRALKPPVIDGELGEWSSANSVVLDRQQQVVPPDPGFWKGPDDLSATVSWMYDDKNLYMACRVKDDIHKNIEPMAKIWAGDSMQIAFANAQFPYGYTELSAGLSSVDGSGQWVGMGVGNGKPLPGMKVVVKRLDGVTNYEMAIPMASLSSLSIVPGSPIRVAFIVNDVDQTARKWIGFKVPGLIGAVKEGSQMPVMLLQVK